MARRCSYPLKKDVVLIKSKKYVPFCTVEGLFKGLLSISVINIISEHDVNFSPELLVQDSHILLSCNKFLKTVAEAKLIKDSDFLDAVEKTIKNLESGYVKEAGRNLLDCINFAEMERSRLFRTKKPLDGGRPKGTKKRQDKATENWKIIDKAIEDFFINGEGFRRDCTNKKITGVVFKSVGKKLRYSETTIAQRVKIKAAEYRKTYAQN